LGAAIPGITYLALASRGSLLRGAPVRGLTWRQLTLAFALSMGVASIIAMYVEMLGDLSATVLMLVHNGTFHHVFDSDGIGNRISDARFILSRNEQWAANLVAVAVVPPIVEEFSKGLGARFMMRGNTTRAQAFALGAAAGAGFGFLEGLMYGLSGISDNLGDWWLIMLIRGSGDSLHVFNTGVVALAWGYWSFGKRPRMAVALFSGAVAMHALWNGLAVTLFSKIFWLRTVDNRTLEIAAYSAFAVISVALMAAIPVIARRLREPLPPPVAGSALAAMAPWLG
jgi:RsiW-degrading membrane proteinase PrsW (M82 family)